MVILPLNKKFHCWRKFDGVPTGITIHYTADDSLKRTVNALIAVNLGYHILIDLDGKIYQGAPFKHCVYHSGRALWNGQRPNSDHLAVALVSWGKLVRRNNAYFSWSGVIIENAVMRQNGYWHAATPEQEISLISFVDWAVNEFNIPRPNICGHNECAVPTGRKVDPGGTLSFTMDHLRRGLTDLS